MRDDMIWEAIRELKEQQALLDLAIRTIESAGKDQAIRGRPPKILTQSQTPKSEQS